MLTSPSFASSSLRSNHKVLPLQFGVRSVAGSRYLTFRSMLFISPLDRGLEPSRIDITDAELLNIEVFRTRAFIRGFDLKGFVALIIFIVALCPTRIATTFEMEYNNF